MSNEDKLFDELSEDEFSEEEDKIEENKVLDEEELVPGDMTTHTWLKNPDVCESVELEVSKIIKKPGREVKNKNTGESFWTGLKARKDPDEKRVQTIIETVNNERFNITSWGLWFKLFGKDSEFQKIAKEKGSYKGIKIKVTHKYNGRDAMAKPEDLMKLRDIATLEDAEEYKKKVAKAMKDGEIYSVEILN